MRVERITLHRVQIPLKSAFKHARAERSTTDAVIVAAHAGGHTGYGEVLPRLYVTGETIEGVLATSAPVIAERLLRAELSDREAVLSWLRRELSEAGTHLSAFGGFELALLDLAGRTFGFGAGETLGTSAGPELPPGVIIGFEIPTEGIAKHCAFLRLSGRRHVKVKVGLPDDRARVEQVARVFKDTPLRLDANGDWTADRAIEVLRSLTDLPIASIEQPVPREDLDGLRRVREETRIPVMADESVCSLADAERLIAAHAADIFNIRLGKHGGMLAAQQITRVAQRHGLSVHLGTMVGETGILTRATELFSRFVPGFDCLDGKGQNEFLLEEDLLLEPRTARSADPLAHGLGITISPERLNTHSVERKEFT